MSYVMSLNPDVSALCDSSSMTNIQSGSNGYAWGDPEYSVGPNIDDMTDGRTVWDSNVSNGFDSSSLPVSIDASTSGTGLSLAGASSIYSSDATLSGVTEVDLRAVAKCAGSETIWSSLTVRFYKGGVLTETIPVQTLVAQATSSSPTEEALAIVTPSASDNDEVLITGSIQLLCSTAAQPGTDQMFCQALIR